MGEREPNRDSGRKPDDFDNLMMRIRDHTREAAALIVAGVGVSILGNKIDNELLNQTGSSEAAFFSVSLVIAWIPKMAVDAFVDTRDLVKRQAEKIRKKKK